jgi:hypothetical protein
MERLAYSQPKDRSMSGRQSRARRVQSPISKSLQDKLTQANGVLVCALSACEHSKVSEPIAGAVMAAAVLVNEAHHLARSLRS